MNDISSKNTKKTLHTRKRGNIISSFGAFSDFLYSFVKKSRIYNFFTSYDQKFGKLSGGLCGAAAEKISHSQVQFCSFKNAFAKVCEKSAVVNFFEYLADDILSFKIKNFAVGGVFFGLYSSVILFLKYYLHETHELFTSNFVFSLLFLLISLILLPSKKSICEVSQKSIILSFVFYGLFCFDEKRADKYPRSSKSYEGVMIIGMVLGALSFLFPPIKIFLCAFSFLSMLLLFKIPENGVVLTFLTIAFSGKRFLTSVILVTFIAFMFKVLRGKRTLKVTFFDICMFLFLVIVLLGGFCTLSSFQSVPHSLNLACLMLVYFSCVSLVRNRTAAEKCINALFLSLTVETIYSAYSYFAFKNTGFPNIELLLQSIIMPRNTLCEFLSAVLPVIIAYIIINGKKINTFFVFTLFVFTGICMYFSVSKGMIPAILISLFLLISFCSRHHLNIFIGAFVFLVSMPFVLPGKIPEIFSNYVSFGNYRISIFENTFGIISKSLLSGIGSGQKLYENIYSSMSHAGADAALQSYNLYLQIFAENGLFSLVFFVCILILFSSEFFTAVHRKIFADDFSKHTCISIFCGITALLVRGFTDYIFCDYRLYVLFFLFIALERAVIFYSLERYPNDRFYASLNS